MYRSDADRVASIRAAVTDLAKFVIGDEEETKVSSLQISFHDSGSMVATVRRTTRIFVPSPER